ncbi:tetratricopeptide repeat protein [Sulfitobacter sp. D35]|uniref:tetratricopeptide repeat protein n=1 Tax=Sulfitobacter sp. D35 TaxID=3083252 RepID=UPI00296E45C9|nr:tetratricopeptide repeat protein [Sulfitobacter sp. D35]MDW4499792.1 tetratricopeptide repeat protein [Sulfitobacter sp. D35]
MIRSLKSSAAALALSLAMLQPAGAQSIAGPYLAARSAAMQSDYAEAAQYFTRALAHDRDNPGLMESAVVALLALGEIDRALPIARRLDDAGVDSQVAEMVLTADSIQNGEFDQLLEGSGETQGIGPLVDGLVRAWAYVGMGDLDKARESFDRLGAEVGLNGFAMFHKALALASQAAYAEADEIFESDTSGSMIQSRRGVLTRAEVLSQLDRNAEALQLLTTMFAGGSDPEIDTVVAALEAGEKIPFTQVTGVQDGFAEVFSSIAAALRSEAGPEYTLLYAQIARNLRAGHVDAILLTADIFETLEQYDQAIATYKQVPPDNAAYHAAELGRADALRRSDRPEAAIEVLEQLARSHGHLAVVQSSLGDLLRQQDRYTEAVEAYDQAIDLSGDDQPSWFLHYARGIAYERLGEWENSEADFRAALEENPDQPQVLNYLGYSLVERKEKLDEALELIERAVAGSPDSGYIIDSLGWALYRLGRYEEAVPHMERAVELMAVDPIVNDHLGDVYWAVGRKREAEFQWHRALSFVDEGETNEEADPERIRRKIEVGLDQVLADEGQPPLTIARD